MKMDIGNRLVVDVTPEAPPTEVPYLTSSPCMLHRRHMPESHVNEIHHIWPLGEGGPDEAANRVVVCPTGHYNVHRLLREWLLLNREPPYAYARSFSFQEREYAARGFAAIRRRSLT